MTSPDYDADIFAQAKERELLRARIDILTIALALARGQFVSFESRRKLRMLNERYPHLAETGEQNTPLYRIPDEEIASVKRDA